MLLVGPRPVEGAGWDPAASMCSGTEACRSGPLRPKSSSKAGEVPARELNNEATEADVSYMAFFINTLLFCGERTAVY